MIDTYTNQRAMWRKRTAVQPNGTPLYAKDVSIPVRFEYKRRVVRDVSGEASVSEAFCMTTAPVEPGDILVYDGREWLARSLNKVFNFLGIEVHREVYL